MSELKCPFCQRELEQIITSNPLGLGRIEMAVCKKCMDKGVLHIMPIWDWQELIRTRKALETIRLHLMTAKGRFNLYDEYLVSGMDSPDARFIKEEIDKALEQITALEQKDVK